jgi:GNAT superfamily N-acetyltransferase
MATRPFEIRPATLEDVEGVLQGYEWLFAPPGQRPPSWSSAEGRRRLERAVTSERSAVWVAVESGRVVGFCTVYLDLESVRFGLRAWAEDLAVDPDRRSRGIGSALLRAAREWARSRSATRLALDSAEARVDAHRFYERERPSYRSLSYGWWLR